MNDATAVTVRKLKLWLQINSGFSILSGLAMLLFASQMNALFGIAESTTILPFIGLGLISFALFVGFTGFRNAPSHPVVQVIALLDLLWVIGSFVIITFRLFSLTASAYVVMAVVASFVLLFGINQLKYNKTHENH